MYTTTNIRDAENGGGGEEYFFLPSLLPLASSELCTLVVLFNSLMCGFVYLHILCRST